MQVQQRQQVALEREVLQAAYDYKIDIISPLNQLKQGFTVSVEVVNEAKQALVPLTAVIKKDKNTMFGLMMMLLAKPKSRGDTWKRRCTTTRNS